MDAAVEIVAEECPAYDILSPAAQAAPVVLASPHSGRDYRPEFLEASRLPLQILRKSEDCYIDELFGAAPQLGVPLLRAHFPRAFVDPNREPFELDPAMFADALPDYVNTTSPRVGAGLGTIARLVTNGEEIYGEKLNFAQVSTWIERNHRPYHAALAGLIMRTRARFGACLLVDCHSMPSIGGPMDRDAGRQRVDFVLGDCHGTSCAPGLIDAAEAALADMGYNVTRNIPYAGGYTTRHYGRPTEGVHALQIEINRALYLDEDSLERRPYFRQLARHMGKLTAAIIEATSLIRS
ncbi:MAG: N-formylglutamate amidohydrolase [Alphaproteobacteria bacterium]